MDDIPRWVEEDRSDEWIASALGTSPSSVQAFRSRNAIYRRGAPTKGCSSQKGPVSGSTQRSAMIRAGTNAGRAPRESNCASHQPGSSS
jgi:hypothetical protein